MGRASSAVIHFFIEHDRIDIGGLVSDAGRATDVLLDGVITVAQALELPTMRGLLLDSAVALPSSLRIRGFALERHLYLSKLLGAPQVDASRRQRLWARLTEKPIASERVETAGQLAHRRRRCRSRPCRHAPTTAKADACSPRTTRQGSGSATCATW